MIPPTPDAPLPPVTFMIRQVDVAFPGGRSVRVGGPAPMADFPANPAQTLLSPRGDAAAVRFCWYIPKYDSCQMRLVRPNGTVQVLKNSNVRRLLWSKDGKYLIGAGVNTVRLWNLGGGVRTAVAMRALPTPGWVYQYEIKRLWWHGSDLCVSTLDVGWARTGKASSQASTTTRYAIPSLKVLSQTKGSGAPGKEAKCRPASPAS